MIEHTNDHAAVDAIAEILARGVCRWWKNKAFHGDNTLKQLDNSRNNRPCVHRKSLKQRRNSDD